MKVVCQMTGCAVLACVLCACGGDGAKQEDTSLRNNGDGGSASSSQQVQSSDKRN
jgi:hypothetical protein